MLFYMAGVTCWSYFAECLNRASGTFIQHTGIFGKVYFPRLCVPVSVVISGISSSLAIQFGLFLGFLGYYMWRGAVVHPNAPALLAPGVGADHAWVGVGAGIICHRQLTTSDPWIDCRCW